MRKIKLILVGIAGIAIASLYGVAYHTSSENLVITVKDKERITTGSGEDLESKYLVYGEEEVFENTDSWLFFKFSSSDFQGELEVGKTYNVKVAGWRIPFMSSYRNIVEIKK